MTYQTIAFIVFHKKSYDIISSSTGNDIVPVFFHKNKIQISDQCGYVYLKFSNIISYWAKDLK